jgi:hypothetical protein
MYYFRINIKYLLASIALLVSCANFSAYFNTFYNAKEQFERAEVIRKKSESNQLPKTALDLYQSSIEKSKYILTEYPEVRFRKEAFLLIVKSHFFKSEFIETNQALSAMSLEFGNEIMSEIRYWTALVKWKEGRIQPAINSLIDLSEEDIHKSLKSKVYLSIAEIYFEQNLNEKSMDYLELAAKSIKDRSEKDQIYFRIADLSFKQADYKRSLFAYKEVIKNTQIKSRMQLCNLKIVQIYRLQSNYDLASTSIKNMLIDENYQSIHPALELELAKLYQIQIKSDDFVSRLNTIIKDYPRTKESAESAYLLGEFMLLKTRNFDEALKFYSMVRSEYRQSLFIKSAQLRIKEINAYSKLILDYNKFLVDQPKKVEGNVNKEIKSINTASKMLYELAELEFLHFYNNDSALVFIDQLLEFGSNKYFLPKSLYMKSVILDKNKDYNASRLLKNRIVNEFPRSDYAYAIIKSDSSLSNNIKTSNDILIEAEKIWKINPDLALRKYKNIVSKDSISESGLRAAYFLAHNYDYNYVVPDSAKKFYEWIIKHHGISDQAKSSKARLSLISNIKNASN